MKIAQIMGFYAIALTLGFVLECVSKSYIETGEVTNLVTTVAIVTITEDEYFQFFQSIKKAIQSARQNNLAVRNGE